jgi:hypothetical protein
MIENSSEPRLIMCSNFGSSDLTMRERKAEKPYISVLTSFSPEKGVPNSYFCAESFM